MSGECDDCGEHALECTCESLSRRQEYGRRGRSSNVNLPTVSLGDGQDPPTEKIPEPRWIGVDSREEHQAILMDAAKCEELGIDQIYEITVYLKRWGSWLGR